MQIGRVCLRIVPSDVGFSLGEGGEGGLKPTNRCVDEGALGSCPERAIGGERVSIERNTERGFGRPLSRESREMLGLGETCDARVVGRAGRLLLLETDEPEGPAVPWDRDLVLSCDVRSFPLTDLLSLVHDRGKSGFLLFQQGGDEKAVYLSRGEVVFAESTQEADRLGASLLRAGLLDAGQLELAESRYDPATRFGKVVVELGMLTARELWNGVKVQVEEIVRSLFSYTEGWIHFWEGEIEPGNVVRLSLPTRRLIDEGLERRDALLRFLTLLEDPYTRIRPGAEARTISSDHERAVLEALQLDACFADICERTGLDARTAARTILMLELTGRANVEEAGAESSSHLDAADDEAVREAVGTHSKLVFELAAPLIAVDGPQEVAARLNRILMESSAGGRPLLAGVRFSDAATLDPDLLVERALGLYGDRLREVDESFGEIVSYLEFELKNHPGIEDCSAYLEAVDPLRAMLVR